MSTNTKVLFPCFKLDVLCHVQSCVFTGSAARVPARCSSEPDAGESGTMGGAPMATILRGGRGPDDVPQGRKVGNCHNVGKLSQCRETVTM
jgi:hypothetical protein